MLDKIRIRAFARFSKEYGTDELMRCLMKNKANGIVYHYDGLVVGDYDKCETEDEVIEMIKSGTVTAKFHYDALIDENNDPVNDAVPLREYMSKWDGQAYIDEMQLSPQKDVLEIGVGTGRLAVKVAPLCGIFTGIDFSPKTIQRAKTNLASHENINLICDDFMYHEFDGRFDVIYSSLTFMHIEDKLTAIKKVAKLLNDGGRFVLSTDKNQSDLIDMGNRKIKIYPDNADDICEYIKASELEIEKKFETEFANIFVARKV